MYFGRYLPITLKHLRFVLTQVSAIHPTPIQSTFVECIVNQPCSVAPNETIPHVQRNYCHVNGHYIHYRSNPAAAAVEPTEYTVLYLYPGAYVAGDTETNISPADYIGSQCGVDVFLPQHRLGPEFHFDDCLWDVALAYRYLFLRRKHQNQDPSKILLVGASSGAALCLRLVQLIAQLQRGDEDNDDLPLLPSYVATVLRDVTMPAGAMLAEPFLNYESEGYDMNGSYMQYSKHDLMINEATRGLMFQYSPIFCGNKDRCHLYSPNSYSMKGLPPLCVTVSQHEATYDETVYMINKARSQGTIVTVGMWKYMFHGWCYFSGLIPEGQEALDFICEWLREQQLQ